MKKSVIRRFLLTSLILCFSSHVWAGSVGVGISTTTYVKTTTTGAGTTVSTTVDNIVGQSVAEMDGFLAAYTTGGISGGAETLFWAGYLPLADFSVKGSGAVGYTLDSSGGVDILAGGTTLTPGASTTFTNGTDDVFTAAGVASFGTVGITDSTTPTVLGVVGSKVESSKTSTTVDVVSSTTTSTSVQSRTTLSGLTLGTNTTVVAGTVNTPTTHITTARDLLQYVKEASATFMALTPIILDLSGTGVPDVSRQYYLPHPSAFDSRNAVLFDMMATGAPQLTEWVGPNAGILVEHVEGGTVSSALQMFGNAGGWRDGFEKLSTLYDKNHDGVIRGDELKGLAVWINKAGDGIVHPGEIVSLESLGIAALSVKHHHYESWYELKNGKRAKMWDWWPSVMPLKKVGLSS